MFSLQVILHLVLNLAERSLRHAGLQLSF
jgi:hypothetical protein